MKNKLNFDGNDFKIKRSCFPERMVIILLFSPKRYIMGNKDWRSTIWTDGKIL